MMYCASLRTTVFFLEPWLVYARKKIAGVWYVKDVADMTSQVLDGLHIVRDGHFILSFWHTKACAIRHGLCIRDYL